MLVAMLSAGAPPPAPAVSIAGGWTMNKTLSDLPPERGDQESGDRRDRGSRGSYGGRRGGGGFGRGGYGGGYGRGGAGGAMDPDAMARMRLEMQDLTNPPEHLVVTQTDSMIVMTAPDGRTIRLSPDGKKIKDENTKLERKTKWDGDKLVTEISGLPRGKATETWTLDSEHHQLRRTVRIDSGRGEPRIVTHVYELDQQ